MWKLKMILMNLSRKYLISAINEFFFYYENIYFVYYKYTLYILKNFNLIIEFRNNFDFILRFKYS